MKSLHFGGFYQTAAIPHDEYEICVLKVTSNASTQMTKGLKSNISV